MNPLSNKNTTRKPSSGCQTKCETKGLTPSIKLQNNEGAVITSHSEQGQLQKVANHPCYSNHAHHRFARMHLPVAPACNIQCNYCNRKYDCANESRPGVVSELLTPEQALLKAQSVAKAIPQLTVIGIAGPGDPLANPVRTLDTLSLIRDSMPDIKLCLSTNGLMLEEHVDTLVKLGVDHITVTLNTLDEVIAAQIYSWIYLDGKRYSGVEAGRLLIERQMRGIAALTKAGVLTKINSVLIPGINDAHLPELSQELRRNDVFLHNIMPLISQPEHGTLFGLNGQREPLEYELDQVRELCGGNVSQMKHCQQCRADAIGMLGEDRSNEFKIDDIHAENIDYQQTMIERTRFQATVASNGASETEPSLIVAIASKNGSLIDLHFGHADCFKLYIVTEHNHHFIGERRVKLYCGGADECDDEASSSTLTDSINALTGVDLLLCSRIGLTPWESLENAGIQPNVDYSYNPVETILPELFSQFSLMAETKWQQHQQKNAIA